MNLADMIKMSKDKVAESMPAPDEAKGITREYIDRLVSQIAVGAIKFQDLKNNIASGYVFELDDFANFDGKTGPYIQYAVARINSIMRKNQNLVPGAVVITNPEERALGLKLTQLSSVVFRAEADKEPSVISDYAYTLAQLFSSFYNASPIMAPKHRRLPLPVWRLPGSPATCWSSCFICWGLRRPKPCSKLKVRSMVV